MTILVIDDAATVRRQLRRVLEAEAYTVIEANDAEEGLQLLSTHAVDLVLCDVNLPGLSGVDFAEFVLAQEAYADLPVLMITTSADALSINRARRLGVKGWIVKPFQGPQVLTVARRILERRVRSKSPVATVG